MNIQVADVNDYIDGKPPHCKMIVQPKDVTITPQDLCLIATMNGLKQPKTIELRKEAQFIDLVCQVFYHRYSNCMCWRVTLAVFPKRLHKVSSCNVAELHTQVFCCVVSHFQHYHSCDQEYMSDVRPLLYGKTILGSSFMKCCSIATIWSWKLPQSTPVGDYM